MNIFIGVLAVFLGTFAGVFLSSKYVKRKKFYSEFNSFNIKLKSEITFGQKTIKELISSLDKGLFQNYLYESFFNNNADMYIVFLNDDENAFLKEYVSYIGRGDNVSQMNYLLTCDESIKKLCNSTYEEEKRYRKLYIKLGFLFGLVILVVLL